MRPRPTNAPVDPARALDDELARLAEQIAALQRDYYDDERRTLRRAGFTLQERVYSASATSVQTTRPHNGPVLVEHIITSATTSTLTLQLMGDANNSDLAVSPSTGLQTLSLSPGLILRQSDIIKLTTTGAAGPMAIIVLGWRLPEMYAY